MSRRKVALTVYLPPDDPLWGYLIRFKDRSSEAARLMRAGLHSTRANTSSVEVTVTERATLVISTAPVTVTADDDPDPGWDEPE